MFRGCCQYGKAFISEDRMYFDSTRINRLVDELWRKYPRGLVANVSKGNVPNECRGLARYLAEYVASPPIAVRRIINYDGKTVTYWYQDHETQSKKVETVDVYTFIGRMVQHIMPKSFHRVRYYGLESTKCFKKWSEVISDGMKKLGKVFKGAYEIVTKNEYRERYKKISGHDPILPQDSLIVEGVDVPFGPPPEEYNYRCSQCRYEMEVNEAIIDVEIGMAKFDGSYHEGF